ncbi:MAG: hypothetical protein HKN20_14445 [Gemmatimonadetes bacterium]|nr:hypothetical protein [Gemmatimonadota bacterium]
MMDLVQIAVLPNDSEALVIRSLLESNGIHVVMRSSLVQSVHPITVDGVGKVRVLVRPEDEEKARELLDTGSQPNIVTE